MYNPSCVPVSCGSERARDPQFCDVDDRGSDGSLACLTCFPFLVVAAVVPVLSGGTKQ